MGIQSTSDQQSSSLHLQSSPGSTGLKESTGSTFDQQSSSLQSSPGSTGSSGWTGSTVEMTDDLIDLKVLPKKSVEMAGKESLNGSCVNPQLQVKQVNKEHLDNGQINAGFLDDE